MKYEWYVAPNRNAYLILTLDPTAALTTEITLFHLLMRPTILHFYLVRVPIAGFVVVTGAGVDLVYSRTAVDDVMLW